MEKIAIQKPRPINPLFYDKTTQVIDYFQFSQIAFILGTMFLFVGTILNVPLIIFLVYIFYGLNIVLFLASTIAWRIEDKDPRDTITKGDLVTLFGGIWIPFTMVATPSVEFVPENPIAWYVITGAIVFITSWIISSQKDAITNEYATDTQSAFAHFALGWSIAFIFSTLIVWTSGYYAFNIITVGLRDFMWSDKTYLSIIGMWLFSSVLNSFKQ